MKQSKKKKFDNRNCINPTDKIEPKFHVGNTITYIVERKELVADNKYTIKEICKDCYISTRGNKIPFSMQEYYTIVNDAKFKVGDWMISKYMHLVMQILNNDNGFYATVETDGTERYDNYDFIERNFKLWSIEDAKPGDVLYLQHDSKEHIIIYKGVIKKRFRTFIGAYCAYNSIVDAFCFADVSRYADIAYGGIMPAIMPATKEQRDALMKAITDAGYTFNFEKKELKEIEECKLYEGE